MKKILSKISILVVILASLASCHTQRSLVSDANHYNYNSENGNKGTSHFFISGLGQTDKIDAVEICSGEKNIKSVESKMTFSWRC